MEILEKLSAIGFPFKKVNTDAQGSDVYLMLTDLGPVYERFSDPTKVEAWSKRHKPMKRTTNGN